MAVMALEPLIAGLAEGGAAEAAGAGAGEAAGEGGLMRGLGSKMPGPFSHGPGQHHSAPKPQVDLVGAVHRVMGPQF